MYLPRRQGESRRQLSGAVAVGIRLVGEVIVLHVQSKAAVTTALRDDYAGRSRGGYLEIGRDDVPAAGQTRRRSRGDAPHPAVIDERCPAGRDQRLPLAFRFERIDVIAPGFAIEEIRQLFDF